MTWNTIFGVTATICLSFPVVTILYFGLHRHRSLLALMISYITTGIYFLVQSGIIAIHPEAAKAVGVVNNYITIPLMLTALLFFCPIKQKQRSVHMITAAFLVYEILTAYLFGVSNQANMYVLGPGLGLVLLYTFYLFARHIRITIHFGKNAGRTLMLVAILFNYGCFGLVYHFTYIQRTPDIADAYLVYFAVSTVASLLMTAGLTLVQKRIRELQEVRNTRRELAIFFNN